MKILNKFVWSKTEPKNKNDIWFDGSVFNLYRNDTWEAFTLPIDAAEKVAEVIKDALNVFQSKLIAGKGINIKDSVISTTTLFNIVNNLPLEGKEDTIYLVLNSEQDTNRFKEYVWINNTWESLGEFKADVDLSNYVTKQLFNSTLAKKAEKSEIPTKLSELEQDIEIGSDYDDTEIKQELTELSEEVSGLSEKVDNLPSAESSVFEAVYGVTTYEEIVEARNKGKEVLCKFNDRIARIVQVMDDVLIYFEVTVGSDSQRIVCYPGNRWDYKYISNAHELKTLDNGNAQITIAGKTAEVATPQYVENLLGTIINGDY